VGDAVHAQQPPAVHLRPEPAAQLRAGRGVELLVPAGGQPGPGRVDERPARRRVARGDVAHHREVVHRAGAVPVEHQGAAWAAHSRAAATAGRRTRARWSRRRRVAHVAGQAGRGRGLGGHDDRPRGHALPARELDLVRADPDDLRPEPDGAGTSAGRELLGDRADPARGHSGRAGQEGRQDELHEARGARELRLERDASEERAQEALDEPVRDPGEVQGDARGGLGPPRVEPGAQRARRAPQEPGQPHRVRGRGDGPERAEGLVRAPARVGHADEPAAGADERPGIERAQVQRVVVQDPRGLGIAREQHLEAAVEEEPPHPVGPHPPAHAVGAVEHDGPQSPGLQLPGGGQARQAGTHDDDGSAIGHRGDYGLGAGALTPSGAVTPAR
jgi:hypothetical protein